LLSNIATAFCSLIFLVYFISKQVISFFVPHFSVENPDEILFDEIWIDKESIDNHFKQPHMKDLFPKIAHLLAKRVVLEANCEVKVSDS
jgi:hypothetical protein